MVKRESSGIQLIGGGLIVSSIWFLVLPLLDLPEVLYKLFNVFHSSLQLVWLISSVILIGFIVGAVQLLKLKEFGRSLILFLAIIDIPHLVVGKAIYNNHHAQPVYLRNFSLIPVSVILGLIIIIFLNHPKVRRQFK